MKSYIVAISGASGSVYSIRLIKELLKAGHRVYLTISKQAFSIIKTETGINWVGDLPARLAAKRAGRQGYTLRAEKSEIEIEKNIQKYFSSKHIRFFTENNLHAPISSGSFITDGMLVVPCSMKTLSGIANGYASNLTERAADVILKEGRRLIIAPREMPFSAIHLENMLKLARLGVNIAPPVPAFYNKPKNIDDIVDFVVGKILDIIGIRHNLFKRWK